MNTFKGAKCTKNVGSQKVVRNMAEPAKNSDQASSQSRELSQCPPPLELFINKFNCEVMMEIQNLILQIQLLKTGVRLAGTKFQITNG